MLTSPLLTLLTVVVGLAAVVAVVASLLGPARERPWAFAVAIVAIVAIGAPMPQLLRDRLAGLNQQRKDNAQTTETAARERCLSDVGHPALAEALAVAREHIPEGARFRLVTSAPVIPCATLNMLPRRPAHPYDAATDWTLHYQAVPEAVQEAAEREQRRPEAQRRYIVHSEEFIIERPEQELTG